MTGLGTSILPDPVRCGAYEIIGPQSSAYHVDDCEARDFCVVDVNLTCHASVWFRDKCLSARSKDDPSAFTSSKSSSGKSKLRVWKDVDLDFDWTQRQLFDLVR